MSGQGVPGGVVHELPADLRTALIGNAPALDAWKDITPLARNEFICWVEDAKQETTRERRIRRTQEELEEGQRRPFGRYRGPVDSQRVPGGVVHKLPGDLREALLGNSTALTAWKDITPLARNEFICWVEDAKQQVTRERRIRRTQEELEEGQRRPCCWPGCKHRERTGR